MLSKCFSTDFGISVLIIIDSIAKSLVIDLGAVLCSSSLISSSVRGMYMSESMYIPNNSLIFFDYKNLFKIVIYFFKYDCTVF